MKKTVMSLALAATLLLSSCATIISGSKQKVSIMSQPEAATVSVNDLKVGHTPFEMKMDRKNDHKIVLSLEGYKNYEVTLTRKFNEWYIGNVLLGGLIGLVIDPITGAIYRLSPKEVNVSLKSEPQVTTRSGKDVYIAVSLDHDANWQKVGQLAKQK